MQLTRGNLQEAYNMALIYTAAFPESTSYYFANNSPDRLVQVVQCGLEILLLLGARALVVKNTSGEIAGYCIYASTDHKQPFGSWLKALGRAFAAVVHLRPWELVKLAHSRLIFKLSAKTEHSLPRKAGRIVSIAVHPDFQGRGLGTMLLKGALAELEPLPVVLEVRTDNPSAQTLYRNFGFYPCGTTRDKLGEWSIMVKPGRDGEVDPF